MTGGVSFESVYLTFCETFLPWFDICYMIYPGRWFMWCGLKVASLILIIQKDNFRYRFNCYLHYFPRVLGFLTYRGFGFLAYFNLKVLIEKGLISLALHGGFSDLMPRKK